MKLAKEKQTSAAKLPRVQIAEFNGSPLDWLRFWGLFVKNVDKRNIPSSDKMSYLLGYLAPKGRDCITGLDYDEQGYKMAKEIPERKFGNKSMVVNAYVSEILCMRYRVKPFLPASTAPLPVTRTEGNLPYSVIKVDFAGPIYYRKNQNQQGKAYLVLFACSLNY